MESISPPRRCKNPMKDTELMSRSIVTCWHTHKSLSSLLLHRFCNICVLVYLSIWFLPQPCLFHHCPHSGFFIAVSFYLSERAVLPCRRMCGVSGFAGLSLNNAGDGNKLHFRFDAQ